MTKTQPTSLARKVDLPIPWREDRKLTLQAAASAIASQCPGLAPVRLVRFGAGWDNEMFLANGQWLFRFPKRQEVDAVVLREGRVLDLVASALAWPVPRFEYLGKPSRLFPYHFAGYRKLPGVPGDQLSPPAAALPSVARQIGGLLSSLHGLPIESLRRAGVRAEGDRTDSLLDEARVLLPSVCSGLSSTPLKGSIQEFLAGNMEPPPRYRGPWRPIHNDFMDQHMLFDPVTHDLAGIIDWADMALGDPAIDFVWLWLWLGEGFVTSALRSYALPLDARFRKRLAFLARVVGIIELGWMLVSGDRLRAKRVQRWLSRALPMANRHLSCGKHPRACPA